MLRRPKFVDDRPAFSTWDGTRISYQVLGNSESPRTVIFVNGLFCTESYWMFLHRDLAPHYRLVSFDLRGHQFSDPPPDRANVTVESCARDVECLMDWLEVESAVVAGFSLGVQISFEHYRRCPERCRALVAITGPFENPLGTLFGMAVPKGAWRMSLGNLARYAPRTTNLLWHQIFRLPTVHPAARLLRSTRASVNLMQPFYDHQTIVDVPTGLRMAVAATEHSARDMLSSIQVPVLVVAGGQDNFTPPELSKVMRDEVPDVEFLEVPDGTHTTLLEAPELVNGRVMEFLDERVEWGS